MAFVIDAFCIFINSDVFIVEFELAFACNFVKNFSAVL